jgi:hypothetical protein
MLLTLLFRESGCVHLDSVVDWVAAEKQREAEETSWRAVAAVMVLAASLVAVLAPAAISAAAMFGWPG